MMKIILLSLELATSGQFSMRTDAIEARVIRIIGKSEIKFYHIEFYLVKEYSDPFKVP